VIVASLQSTQLTEIQKKKRCDEKRAVYVIYMTMTIQFLLNGGCDMSVEGHRELKG
jgi:hypothetical protein